MRSTLEKALIAQFNNDTAKANALMHEFVIGRSRQIHESLRQGEDFDLDMQVAAESAYDEDLDFELDESDGDDVAAPEDYSYFYKDEGNDELKVIKTTRSAAEKLDKHEEANYEEVWHGPVEYDELKGKIDHFGEDLDRKDLIPTWMDFVDNLRVFDETDAEHIAKDHGSAGLTHINDDDFTASLNAHEGHTDKVNESVGEASYLLLDIDNGIKVAKFDDEAVALLLDQIEESEIIGPLSLDELHDELFNFLDTIKNGEDRWYEIKNMPAITLDTVSSLGNVSVEEFFNNSSFNKEIPLDESRIFEGKSYKRGQDDDEFDAKDKKKKQDQERRDASKNKKQPVQESAEQASWYVHDKEDHVVAGPFKSKVDALKNAGPIGEFAGFGIKDSGGFFTKRPNKPVKESLNNPDYEYYVVADGKIESGWEYQEDAAEHVAENMPEKLKGKAKIHRRSYLKKLGLEVSKDSDWLKTGVKEGKSYKHSDDEDDGLDKKTKQKQDQDKRNASKDKRKKVDESADLIARLEKKVKDAQTRYVDCDDFPTARHEFKLELEAAKKELAAAKAKKVDESEASLEADKGWWVIDDRDVITNGPFPSKRAAQADADALHDYEGREYHLKFGTRRKDTIEEGQLTATQGNDGTLTLVHIPDSTVVDDEINDIDLGIVMADDDFRSLGESIIDELEQAHTDGKDGYLVGAGGKFKQERHSPVPNVPFDKRASEARPVKITGPENNSFERQPAPKVDVQPTRQNAFKTADASVSKPGHSGKALLNQMLGSTNTRSPVPEK